MIVSATAIAQTGTKVLVAVRVLAFIGTVSLRETTRACQM
jgi:hypothetical protein